MFRRPVAEFHVVDDFGPPKISHQLEVWPRSCHPMTIHMVGVSDVFQLYLPALLARVSPYDFIAKAALVGDRWWDFIAMNTLEVCKTVLDP